MSVFKLHLPFQPTGDQPHAIAKLAAGRPGMSTLLGVTGSGKTFTIAQVIARQEKPVLILSPNKTLAAQLYEEFSLFFPENKVCYFVSYYDYYQPESYLPAQDIYIPKETKINNELDRLRIESTASIINRKDTIVISSVSCIYSLGNPKDFRELAISLSIGQSFRKQDLARDLINIQYQRDEWDRGHGTFQMLPDALDIVLPYQKEILRVEFLANKVDRLIWLSRENRTELKDLDNALIFPAKHFVTTEAKRKQVLEDIEKDLKEWLPRLQNPIYRERLSTRVYHDLEMLRETGTCQGIENYSSYFESRTTGMPPYTLLDFFDDFLFVIDESHLALPQLRGMHAGDQARKKTLIDFGFRLPSARDNRPLKFEEIERYFNDIIFVSATPGEYELTKSDVIAEQIIRPTGVADPHIEIHPRTNQLDYLLSEIKRVSANGFRTLVTVLTKKLAEELAHYLEDKGIAACYLHHDLKTPQRTELIHKLRLGTFECLIGINLLREGLDIPEVALVAIMDTDIESFLRDKRSLIQTIGRAARNSESKVIMFADRISNSMELAISETNRRRSIQEAYNIKNNITPQSTKREVSKSIIALAPPNKKKSSKKGKQKIEKDDYKTEISTTQYSAFLEKEMNEAAEKLDFEKAIRLRDELIKLTKKLD